MVLITNRPVSIPAMLRADAAQSAKGASGSSPPTVGRVEVGGEFARFRSEVAADEPPPAYDERGVGDDGPPPAYQPPTYQPPAYQPPAVGELPPAYSEKPAEAPPSYEASVVGTTKANEFLASLEGQYGKSEVDYVLKRFFYHYQKPPAADLGETDRELLKTAMRNYKLTNDVAEKVAKKYGLDNAWQGLFQVAGGGNEGDEGFDGIFAPAMDEQKLLKLVMRAAAEIKGEGTNAPPAETTQTSSAHLWLRAWATSTPHGPESMALSGANEQKPKIEVKRISDLPPQLERIYRSHQRNLQLLHLAAKESARIDESRGKKR